MTEMSKSELEYSEKWCRSIHRLEAERDALAEAAVDYLFKKGINNREAHDALAALLHKEKAA